MKNPEKTKIIVSPKGSISDEKLNERIKRTRIAFEAQFAAIDGINHPKIQVIAMFAVLDSMAQEASNYPMSGENRLLVDFIITHSKTYDYLDKTEPITLLYHIISKLYKTKSNAMMEKHTKEVFSQLGYDWEHMTFVQAVNGRCVYDINTWATLMGMAEKELTDLNGKHRLANLLVQMRHKAMHEMSGLGMPQEDDPEKTEPYYEESTRLYDNGIEYAFTDDVVLLYIPNRFLRTILKDCIDGYLEDCRAQRRTPFSNNRMTRKHVLTWYND